MAKAFFISNNKGDSWTNKNTGLGNEYINALLVHGAKIYAGTQQGVYVSTNDGNSWSKATSGMGNASIQSFGVSGNRIMAGTNSNFYVSGDFAASWTSYNAGMKSGTFTGSIASSNKNLFAGTLGRGIWQVRLDAIPVATEEVGVEHGITYLLHQNVPNPFNNETEIRFEIPFAGHVVLDIFDAFGRPITRLVDEQLESGAFRTFWTPTNVPSGIYYYRIRSGKYQATKNDHPIMDDCS